MALYFDKNINLKDLTPISISDLTNKEVKDFYNTTEVTLYYNNSNGKYYEFGGYNRLVKSLLQAEYDSIEEYEEHIIKLLNEFDEEED